MAFRRRELTKTDETTLSEGLRRNIELEDIAAFASAKDLPIKHFVKLAKDDQKRDTFEIAVSNDNFLKPQGMKDGETPRETLKRALSVRSVLSTASSFAERMERLKSTTEDNLSLTEIGRGSFGTVFEIPGTTWCLKKTLVRPEDLWMEFANGKLMSIEVNQRAANTILRSQEFGNSLMPRVPRYLCTYGMDRDAGDDARRWFAEHGKMFPIENGGQKPGPVNCLERILPLPEVIRRALIKEFFPPEKQSEALVNPANKACLCRPYLGQTSKDVGQQVLYEKRSTLQNFPLYLDELEELQMDPFMIARDMALGLAAGHWVAHMNMVDVEFVIGSRPVAPDRTIDKPLSREDVKAARERSTRRARNMSMTDETVKQPTTFRNRAIQLWMIDFNKVASFEAVVYPDEEYRRQIETLVDHTRSTDGPYHPRAVARDEWEWDLWCEFSETYVKASEAMLAEVIEEARLVGLTAESWETTMRIMERPRQVIKRWIIAELNESESDGRSFKQFMTDIKRRGWKMPMKAKSQQDRSSQG